MYFWGCENFLCYLLCSENVILLKAVAILWQLDIRTCLDVILSLCCQYVLQVRGEHKINSSTY